MKKINKRMVVIFCLVVIGISLIVTGILISNDMLLGDKQSQIIEEKMPKDEVTDDKLEIIAPIELRLGDKRDIIGGQLLKINDYELSIPLELVEIGYSISIDNNILTITSDDNNYKFVMYQLTDNYIAPKEIELDKFYESVELQQLDEKYYNDIITIDEYDKEYEKLQIKYFKELGYKADTSIDYVLPSAELEKIRGSYSLSGEENSSGSNGLFPGIEYYTYYDWGCHKIYAIPKLEESSIGKYESDFSAYIEVFEYFDDSIVNYNIDLWTL